MQSVINLPDYLYEKHIYIKSGKSSFNRMHKQDIDVYESLYLNVETQNNYLF